MSVGDLARVMGQISVETCKYVELSDKFEDSVDRTCDKYEVPTARKQPTLLIWSLESLLNF
jgi:hypothetical protein